MVVRGDTLRNFLKLHARPQGPDGSTDLESRLTTSFLGRRGMRSREPLENRGTNFDGMYGSRVRQG